MHPFSRGFAFVLLEGPESPYDWGIREIKGKQKNAKTLEEVKKLIGRYRPEVLVIEDAAGGKSRRTTRIRRLYRLLIHLAKSEYVDTHRYSRSVIKQCFAPVGATTKHEIAKAIAMQIPAFAHRIPRERKPWMSEDSRQSLFDAAALGLTYYAHGVPSPYADEIS